MKTSRRLLLSIIGILSISSCGSAPKETYSYRQIEYTLKEGHSINELEGAPWINSNVRDIAMAVEQPSIKDDFYLHVNQEAIINNEKGLFDLSSDIVRQNCLNVFKSDVSYKDKNVLDYYFNNIFEIDYRDVVDYVQSIDYDSFISSKELLTLPSMPVKLYSYGNQIRMNINYGQFIALPFLNLYAYYAKYYADYRLFDTVASNIYDTIYCDLLGYSQEETDNIYSAVKDLTFSYYDTLYIEVNYDRTVTSTVEDFPIESLKNAMLDFGLSSEQVIRYFPSVVNVFNDFISNQYYVDLLKGYMLFDYRYLLGRETYNAISTQLVNAYYFEDDFYISEDISDERAKLALIRSLFPEIYDRAYIDLYATDETRNAVSDLINEIISGYKSFVRSLNWLGSQSKAFLLRKLENIEQFSLYSDKVKNYPLLDYTITESTTLFDIYNANLNFFNNVELQGLYETEVGHPYVVNAYYSAQTNSFIILLGLLADEDWISGSKEEAYAKVGFVIAHEISHGFDPNCIFFDEYGRQQRSWGDAPTMEKYNKRIDKMTDFYSNVRYLNFVRARGENMRGETFADLGAMTVLLSMAKQINDFDYSKFFIQYAKTWLDVSDRDSVYYYLEDTHAMPYLRVNGVLCHFDEFIKTFNIKKGDGMYIPPSYRINLLNN